MATYTTNKNGSIDAEDYGVVGDGRTDVTGYLQDLLYEKPVDPDVWVQLPPGGVKLTAMVEGAFNTNGKAGWAPSLALRGAGPFGTTVFGDFPGPLLKRSGHDAAGSQATGAVSIADVRFNNFHADGGGLQLERVQPASLRRLTFQFGAFGLAIGREDVPNQDVFISEPSFSGQLTQPGGNQNGIGADISAGTFRMVNPHGTNCPVVLDLGGCGSVSGMHFEVNGIAARLSRRRPFQGVLEAGDFEANCWSVIQCLKGTRNLTLANLHVVGTGNPVQTQPNYGIELQPGTGTVAVNECDVTGLFQKAAVYLAGDGPVTARGSQAGVKGAAGVPCLVLPPMTLAKLSATNCTGF